MLQATQIKATLASSGVASAMTTLKASIMQQTFATDLTNRSNPSLYIYTHKIVTPSAKLLIIHDARMM
eukprot:4079-Heterococcus_DN1.PRE.5